AGLINRRYSFLRPGEVVLPEHFAVILIVGAQLPIGRAACQDQAAGCDDDTASWRNTPDILAAVAQCRQADVWNMPQSVAPVEVIGCELSRGRSHDGEAADAFRRGSSRKEIVRR